MKRAFTLVEVIVAIGIFGLGVLGLAGFFAASAQTTRVARFTTTATNLAQGVIEEEISKSYDELATSAKMRFSEDDNNPFYPYWKQVNVSLIDSDLASSATDVGLKKIDVFVYWPEGSVEKNMQMSTVVSKQ